MLVHPKRGKQNSSEMKSICHYDFIFYIIFVVFFSSANRVSVASAKKQAAEEAKNSRTKSIASVPARKTTGTTTPTTTTTTTSKAKVKRKSQKMSNLAKKKKKLYCICQTPYDDSKYDHTSHFVDIFINKINIWCCVSIRRFYVGCDLCNNWFHGDCVNITEDESKDLSEFICSECKHARDTQELFCLCRQPYDETQFYICCDKCQDW